MVVHLKSDLNPICVKTKKKRLAKFRFPFDYNFKLHKITINLVMLIIYQIKINIKKNVNEYSNK